MKSVQGAVQQTLTGVQRFLDDNAAKLPGIAGSGARQRLDDAIARLSGHATAQDGHAIIAQGATQTYRDRRTALLRDHVRPIARIAAAELAGTPAIESLRIPRGKLSAPKLAALANGMATAAAPYVAVFTKAGLPADFLAQITAASDSMMASLSDRATSRGKRGGATAGLTVTASDARKVINMLDALVKRALGGTEPALLADWRIVKHVPQKTSVSKPSTPSTPSTPAGSAPAAPPLPAPPTHPAPATAATPSASA